MTTLPDPAQHAGHPTSQSVYLNPDPGVAPPPSSPVVSVGSMHKEAGMGGSVEVGLRDISGQEVELPKEVSHAGVQVQPTTIPIPPKVQQMGVQPTGTNVPPPVQITQHGVPLTDDQIVQGLKSGVTTSWRWLAEWCVRRLKHLHHKMTQGNVNH